MSVYLIHFSGRLGTSGRNSAQHYLGYTEDGDELARLAEHQRGAGAKITRAAVHRGYDLELVQVWPGDRAEERRLKKRGHFSELCPICNHPR